MRGTCRVCGTTGSIELFFQTAEERQVTAAAIKLPKPVQDHLFQYLALFRPASNRSLTPTRALKLVEGLTGLIKSGYIQIERRPARKCPPHIWAAAMEEMLARRDRLTRPMPNHNYLRDVAYTLADREDAANEKKVVEAERSGNIRSLPDEENDAVAYAAMSYEQWNMLPPSVRKRHQHLRGK